MRQHHLHENQRIDASIVSVTHEHNPMAAEIAVGAALINFRSLLSFAPLLLAGKGGVATVAPMLMLHVAHLRLLALGALGLGGLSK